MSLDVAAYDAVLKESYEKDIIVLTNSRIKTSELFAKEEGPWEGRHVRYPLSVGRNQGVMFTSENGSLPDAGQQEYVETQIPVRYCHGRIQLSIQVMTHSRSSKGAFKRAMDQEMRGLVRDLANDNNRTVFGAGLGVLALVDAGFAGTTINVDSPGNVAGTVNGARWLQKNMLIHFVNPGTGLVRSGGARKITAIASNGASVTIDSAVDASVAENDYIVRAAKPSTSTVGNTSYNKEAMGLLGLIDDGTYVNTLHNVNRTTYPIFQSFVMSSVGPLSADAIQRSIDVVDQIGEGSIGKFIAHHSVRRAYLTLSEVDRRYMGADLKSPDVGTKAAKQGAVTFGDIEWLVDKDCPYGMLFGIDKSYFTRWVEKEGEWADDDGTILLRLQDVDAYEARYRMFYNRSNDRPATCFRMDGINATVVVAHVN
jgi:hypothetical protein